jgi:alpha-glucosidase
VSLPWVHDAPNLGFGPGTRPHLPPPSTYSSLAVDLQETEPSSTLSLYRRALALRRKLQCGEELQWIRDAREDNLLHLKRPSGWEVIMNFGSQPAPLPNGKVAIASSDLHDNALPRNTTVWLLPK